VCQSWNVQLFNDVYMVRRERLGSVYLTIRSCSEILTEYIRKLMHRSLYDPPAANLIIGLTGFCWAIANW
jgi:hypothetical protein